MPPSIRISVAFSPLALLFLTILGKNYLIAGTARSDLRRMTQTRAAPRKRPEPAFLETLDMLVLTAEDDRNGRGRLFGCARSEPAAGRRNNGHAVAHQISYEFRPPGVIIIRPAIFDPNVATFDVTRFAQALEKRGW
jgi:hypothetical protein